MPIEPSAECELTKDLYVRLSSLTSVCQRAVQADLHPWGEDASIPLLSSLPLRGHSGTLAGILP